MELKTFTVTDLKGNVIPSATITVYNAGTLTLATGLEDNNAVALSNPFNASSSGQVNLAAPDGSYDIKVVGSGRSYTYDSVQFFDTNALVHTEFESDFSGLSSGPVPATADTGQALVLSYGTQGVTATPKIVSGLLSDEAAYVTGGAGSGSYTQVDMGAPVTRLRAEFTFGTTGGGETSGQKIALVVWKDNVYPSGTGPVPDSPFHLVLGTTGWSFGTWNSNAYTILANANYDTGFIATPDGSFHTCEAFIDYSTSSCVIVYDGMFQTPLAVIEHPSIASLAGNYACFETFYTTVATDTKCGFKTISADTTPIPDNAEYFSKKEIASAFSSLNFGTHFRRSAAWGLGGVGFKLGSGNFVDTSSSGTVGGNGSTVHIIGSPKIRADSATTYTSSWSTLYIGKPVASANVTFSGLSFSLRAAGAIRAEEGCQIFGGVARINEDSNYNVSVCTGASTGSVVLCGSSAKLGFFANPSPQNKLTITGSRGGNAALASLLTALASYGLITDSTTA